MKGTWWVRPGDLDPEQTRIIGLPLDGKSDLVLGPPGSGKSNLLLLRANYLSLAGQTNIVVISFTGALRDFMLTGAAQYSFSADNILTSIKWQRDLLWQYGVTPPAATDFKEHRKLLGEQVADLVDKRKLSGLYDAILLDEAQDYLQSEIEIFRKLAAVLFVVADSRQKIYGGPDVLPFLRTVVDRTHELRRHYRNGRKICRLADALAKDTNDYEPMLNTSNYDEAARPSTVDLVPCSDLNQQATAIAERLRVQLQAYPDELLGVVCPRRDEARAIYSELSRSEFSDVIRFQSDEDIVPMIGDDVRIVVSTVHSAKGLEFRALHFAGCEFIKRFQNQRNLTFTAVTRAKTSLTVYHSAAVPGFFEKALGKLGPEPDLPSLTKVFGGGE